jgi:trk system potassium uptake protein TrkH
VVWSLHSRVVLKMSTLLVIGGAAVLIFTGLTAAEESLGARVWHALFQSVTARTAGFNTVDIGALPLPSLLILVGLMFVGGSPGSCAGGIKTTSAAVWLARVRARLAGRDDVTLERRRVPHDVVRRAALLLSVATLWNLAGVMILSLCAGGPAGLRLEQLIFEQISAFGTVGLSANPGTAISLSGTFSAVGKLWIILTMFVGRLGPLTIALAVIPRPRAAYEYPTERVMIG